MDRQLVHGLVAPDALSSATLSLFRDLPLLNWFDWLKILGQERRGNFGSGSTTYKIMAGIYTYGKITAEQLF